MVRDFLDWLHYYVAGTGAAVGRQIAYIPYSLGITRERAAALLQQWREKRNLRHIVQGVPAMLGVLAAVTIGFFVLVQSRAELVLRYRESADKSLKGEDVNAAAIAYARLALLDPTAPEGRFGLGEIASRAGDLRRAAAYILPLAPRQELGYPPAHVWRARQLLSQPVVTPAQLVEAEAHLARALQGDPENYEAQALLAKVYLDTNRVEQAEPLVDVFGTAWPLVGMQLARLYHERREPLKAARLAERMVHPLQKRLREHPDDHLARQLLAEAFAVQGNYPQAAHLLREGLAIDPQAPFGVPLANTYLQWAELVSRDPQTPVRQRRDLVEQAIALIQRHVPDSPEKHARLYRLYQALGKSAEAEQHLQAAAEALPELRIELARLYQQRGAVGKAGELARQSLAEFQDKLRSDPKNDRARLLAADAALVLGDFQQSVTLLQAGWRVNPHRIPGTNATYGAALSKVYHAWWEKEASPQSNLSAADRLDLLRLALTYDPTNMDVLQQLLLQGRAGGDAAAQVKAMVQDLLVKGEASAVAHLLLGSDALEQNQLDTARRHLEQAYELNPQLVDVANNLAQVLLRADPPDLARALPLLNSAIKSNPRHPGLRETRGKVLVQMKKWEEALTDLEIALPYARGKPELHRLLAESYDGLGQKELARKHQALAQQPGP